MSKNIVYWLAGIYMGVATAVSGLVGTVLWLSDEVELSEDRFNIVDAERRIVEERVTKEETGVPFVWGSDSLSRIWDFRAGQVCTEDSGVGMALFVMSGSSAISCQSMDDFKPDYVAKVQAALQAPAPE